MMTAEENLEIIELENSARNAEQSPKITEVETPAPTVRIDLVTEDTKEEEVSHNFID